MMYILSPNLKTKLVIKTSISQLPHLRPIHTVNHRGMNPSKRLSNFFFTLLRSPRMIPPTHPPRYPVYTHRRLHTNPQSIRDWQRVTKRVKKKKVTRDGRSEKKSSPTERANRGAKEGADVPLFHSAF